MNYAAMRHVAETCTIQGAGRALLWAIAYRADNKTGHMRASEQVKWVQKRPGGACDAPGHGPTYQGGEGVSQATPWTCGQAPQEGCECDECDFRAHEQADIDTIRAHVTAALLLAQAAPFDPGANAARYTIGVVKEVADQLGISWDQRPAISPELRAFVYERNAYRCVVCATRDNLSVDHIIPISRGGTNNPDNLQTLCKPCNSRKGAR